MVSVLIAHRNDEFIYFTVNALLKVVNLDHFEILIYDDASEYPLSVNSLLYPNVRVIYGDRQRGVGYAFDAMVKQAKYDTIVLMGSDVIIKDASWFDTCLDYTSKYPKGIACSTCLSADPSHLDPLQPADDVKRYGARLLPFVTSEQLPSDSPLLENTSKYVVDMWNGRWFKSRPTENINEVPCLMGAFYVTTKSWYNHIGGWDNSHRQWGCLEAWISLKSWLMGGFVHNIRDLETAHIFHKFGAKKSPHGRTDMYWYNKFFVAYTMMPEDLAKRLIDKVYLLRARYELYTLPFNLGNKLIKQDWANVQKVHDRNQMLFERDFEWFCQKFNIEIDF